MAMSGVKVNDECIKMWEKLKSQKIKACNFKLSSNLKERWRGMRIGGFNWKQRRGEEKS